MAHATEGIRRLHSAGCPARDGGNCNCDRGYEASAWDPAAKRKIRRVFPTLADARGWQADARAAVRRGSLRAADPVTVNDAADALIEGMRSGVARNRSGLPYKPSVVRGYEQMLDLHVRPDLGAMRLADVRRRHVQAIIDRLVADGAAPSSVRNAIMPVRVIFRRAVRDELVAVSPCTYLDLPANRRSRPRVVAPEVVARRVALLETTFDRALWATTFYAGLRRGELLALRWRNVDLGNGVIHVDDSYDPKARQFVGPKSPLGTRDAPVTVALRDALTEHRLDRADAGPDDLVFSEGGKPFDDEAARNRARAIWTTAGLEPVGLHAGRHQAASQMIAAKVEAKDLQEHLGHSS